MHRISAITTLSLACAGLALAQGRALDWSFYGGDAQRTGWEKSDSRITKDNVKEFQLVLKRKLENRQQGPRSLTPPVVIGLLISYKGFKELAFVAGSDDNLWSIDADVDRIFWHKHFGAAPQASGAPCASVVAATPSLTPPVNFAARPRPAPGATPAAPPAAPSASGSLGAAGGILRGGGFGAPRPAFAVSSDGKLHLLNTSTGDDFLPPIQFLPAGARASSLVVHDGVIYTTTSPVCGGSPNGVWAMDLSGSEPKAASYPLGGGSAPRLGGVALGTDGTVFVQTGPGPSIANSATMSNALLALSPKDLQLQTYFMLPGGRSAEATAVAPVVFTYKDRNLVVSAGSDGRLYLLDAQSPGGADHQTPLHRTPPVSASGQIWGGLSSWQDEGGTRWVLAPVWGPLSPELKAPSMNGAASKGSIVAFRVEDSGGQLTLAPAWVSREMTSPEPPVITSGVVFALSAGEYGRDERPRGSSHAVLYALDGATGKEIYSTGNQVTSPANLTGMTIANGRVFFTTNDNTLYAFGIYLER